MRHVLRLCLGVLVVVTGCTAGPLGGPAEQDRTDRVVLDNGANETRTFTVWVVDGEVDPDGIAIHRGDGDVDTASPGQGLSLYHLGGEYGHVTSVEPPPDRSRLHGRYVLGPGETERRPVENVTVGSTVVVSLAADGRVIGLVAANCAEQALVGLEVHGRPDHPAGAWAGYECR